ncbi:hypothetical protein A3Q56_03115 [Intoshia linei]|uniref:Uncharacterized protein n=1 Tax=Intoshia linei TaxID=1819745 RepID=A0A177B4U1_9BILA|nr:hypothetical protein A3Q56_03115 [Intoshia linei]
MSRKNLTVMVDKIHMHLLESTLKLHLTGIRSPSCRIIELEYLLLLFLRRYLLIVAVVTDDPN